MRPELRRDPDALDRVAARLDDLVADLRAAVGAGPAGEHGIDALRIADELESLAGTARYCAGTARAADAASAAAFRAVPGHPAGPVPAGPPTVRTELDPR
ncbi:MULTISPECIES: hypothetical protein [Pseudonocardia]|uniref:Uncharacterized protein n=2 Tax=Pseudonocardia TaxID=1847 RepID=A0A1Y2N0T5_PSEAH|nr:MULTISPECIES: hypothetical protein [Pseudonocardia]OSY41040.1 hypothetical protein BG845_02382 [Pseudonocardia autotrophica]TDN73832.1 hypothetical protein C8E95_2939 [Pseudonocardia autotrophica]